MFDMTVYPACLNCMWREFEETESLSSKGAVSIFECRKLPVCKLVEGQQKFTAEKER